MRRDERHTRTERRPQGAGSLLVALALALALAPGVARAQGAGPDTVTLAWTAPGDDDNVGTGAAYEMRLSGSPIDESNWSSAAIVNGAPAPLPAGTRQSMVVRGLTAGITYYFAIKTVDDAGNWSGISNLLRWDWVYDTAPPAAPSGLNATLVAGGGVRVSWTPNAEADLAGYTVYRALSAGGPYAPISGSLVTIATYVDAAIPAGTATVWYQVTARDDSGNESARSSAVAISLEAGISAWSVQPGYPNPSGRGVTVRIPLVVPAAGGEARIEIVNNAGQRVRRLELGSLAAGTPVVQWDGRNDAGREVAPGAYTAWLISGSTRIGVRLVRVP